LMADYFLPMAERVYGDAAANEPERNAATLARWIVAERPAEVHVRHLQREVRLPGIRGKRGPLSPIYRQARRSRGRRSCPSRRRLWSSKRGPLGRQPGKALWPSDWPIKSLDRIRANWGLGADQVQHLGDDPDRKRRAARLARLIAQQAFDALLSVSRLPAPDRRSTGARAPRDAGAPHGRKGGGSPNPRRKIGGWCPSTGDGGTGRRAELWGRLPTKPNISLPASGPKQINTEGRWRPFPVGEDRSTPGTTGRWRGS